MGQGPEYWKTRQDAPMSSNHLNRKICLWQHKSMELLALQEEITSTEFVQTTSCTNQEDIS